MTAEVRTERVPTRVGDLAGLDAIEHEAIALFIASDVRPLRGVAGYVDWRTNGALSRCLLGGSFNGARGEVLLAPTRGRLGARRFFLFGVGPQDQASRDGLRELCATALHVCEKAGVRKVAMAAPEGLEAAFVSAASEVGQGRIDLILVGPESSPR